MKTVLLIEDEALLRGLLRDIFADSGFAVYEAQNGAEALTIVENNKFDLVVSDIEMPLVNGIEFLKAFRDRDRFTPVVMMSGGFVATEEELLALGANKFIRKPFVNIQSFVETVTIA